MKSFEIVRTGNPHGKILEVGEILCGGIDAAAGGEQAQVDLREVLRDAGSSAGRPPGARERLADPGRRVQNARPFSDEPHLTRVFKMPPENFRSVQNFKLFKCSTGRFWIPLVIRPRR